jgi:hypothetical protein
MCIRFDVTNAPSLRRDSLTVCRKSLGAEEGLHMSRTKLIGFAIAASLLFGYEPAVEASPMAAPPSAVGISDSDGLVVQAVVRGVARRTTRRTARRVYRRH